MRADLNFALRLAAVSGLLATLFAGCAKAPPTPTDQAKVLYSSADWVGTVDLTTKILQESPNDVEALYYRAQSYLALKMYDQSIVDYTQIIQLEPDKAEGYYGRELAYRRAGITDLADADGLKGRDLDVQYKTAYAYDSKNFMSPSGIDLNANDERSEEGEDGDRDDDYDSRFAENDRESDDKENTYSSDDPAPTWGFPDEGLADFSSKDPTNDVSSYDPVGEAASILDRELDKVESRGSLSEKTKVAEQEKKAEKKSDDFLANFPTKEDFNIANNKADNKANNLVDDGTNELAELIERLEEKANRPGDALVGPGAVRDPFMPGEPTDMPDNFVLPPRPTISTALPSTPAAGMSPGSVQPLGMPSAPGVAAPRSTGISSNPPTAQQQYGGFSVNAPGTTGNLQPGGIQPGQFQGNTIYSPGAARPTLSTAMPGTAPQIETPQPGFVPRNTSPIGRIGALTMPRGPILSTQLPADRAVTPGAMARPTGITTQPGIGNGGGIINGSTSGFVNGNPGIINSSPVINANPIINNNAGGLSASPTFNNPVINNLGNLPGSPLLP